jgi:hypothetical protein
MSLTNEQLGRLTAPEGWTLLRTPTLRTAGYLTIDAAQALSYGNAVARLDALHTWAKRNDLGLRRVVERVSGLNVQTFHAYLSNNYHDLRFPIVWKLVANKPELLDNIFGAYTCFCGRKELSYKTAGGCNHCGRHYCDTCSLSYVKQFKVPSGAGHIMLCAECSSPCKEKKGCGGRTYGNSKCHVCNPTFTCTNCYRRQVEDGKQVEVGLDDPNNYDYLARRYERQYGRYLKGNAKVCSACVKASECKTCKKFDLSRQVARGGECALCASAKIEKERIKHETFPPDWVPKHGSLVIPSVAFRPFRTISYEMELDGDGELVAQTLYRCGLVPMSRVATYNQHPDDTKAEYPCFMKHDGSVSAGEIIAYLLNLDDQSHADALMDTCRKVRSLIEMKKASIGPTCGGHIHADAHNFSYGDCWRLLTLFNYIEDPLYRIAGAGSPDGHRSLNPENRARNGGEGYTNSPVKGPFGTKGVLGQSIQGQRRNSGLNFTPYIAAAGLCECGSMAYEDSKNCKCNLGKSTIEWRIFNSTANPRILHAWIALVQAMMAWSEGDADPTPEWEKQYEAFPWLGKSFDAISSKNKETVRSRVEWIFRNLPLTEDERDSLAYAVEQSDIDMAAIDLRAIIPLNDFPHKKAARNPARRKRALKTEQPTPGAPEKPVAMHNGGEQHRRETRLRQGAAPFRQIQHDVRAIRYEDVAVPRPAR